MNHLSIAKILGVLTVILTSSTFLVSVSYADKRTYIDLTHPLPTFEPSTEDFEFPVGNPNSSVKNFPLPDLSQPNPDSTGFTGEPTQEWNVPNKQAVLGNFRLTRETRFHKTLTTFAFNPNLATSIDAPAHRDVLDPAAVAAAIGFGLTASDFAHEDKRHINELPMDELVGKIVFIDISQRVQAEIDRHGGDLSSVDFSNSSGNNVERADIDAIARKLKNGAWVIIRTSWDRFFHDTVAYGNENNRPGITPEAVVRLVEIEKERNIRINGIGADNRGVDTGESSSISGAGSTPAHNVGLNRGWKLLENLTNLELLKDMRRSKKNTLIVAPVNLIGAAESYARVLARVHLRKN